MKKIRLNISKRYVVWIFYLYIGEAAVLNNTPWHLLFKDVSALFLEVLAFWRYWQLLEKAHYAYFVHNEKCYFSTTGGVVEIRDAVRTEQITLKHFTTRYIEVWINYCYLSPWYLLWYYLIYVSLAVVELCGNGVVEMILLPEQQ